MKHMTFQRAIVSAAAFIACSSAWATNGMLMEGYGPVRQLFVVGGGR